jgi:tetratricopeptide (TPR) repeat protein
LAHIDRALALNPNSARAWELCGWVSFSLGQHEKSIACFEMAMRLSPLDPLAALPYAGIAWPFFFTGRYDESIAWADKACREMPNSALPLRPKIAAAALAGRMAEAEDAIRRLRAINPDVSIARLMRIDISRPRAQRDRVEEAFARLGCRNELSGAERSKRLTTKYLQRLKARHVQYGSHYNLAACGEMAHTGSNIDLPLTSLSSRAAYDGLAFAFFALSWAMHRRVFVQRTMGSHLIVVSRVGTQHTAQMRLAKHDDVIQPFAANRSN